MGMTANCRLIWRRDYTECQLGQIWLMKMGTLTNAARDEVGQSLRITSLAACVGRDKSYKKLLILIYL